MSDRARMRPPFEPTPSGVRSRRDSSAPGSGSAGKTGISKDRFKPGDKLGSFTVVARLRHGGMATLYLAERSGAAGFAKYVAIKVVHLNLATNAQFREMFLDEARLCARIAHPNVVHVEELGELDGTYFLAMEFVAGCALGQLLKELQRRKRQLAPELAVSIAMQIADGLHGAHQTRGPDGALLGVVHRDVSPDNVMLAYAGHVKLVDFGIAKAGGRSAQTEIGVVKGKFRYMAPEQVLGGVVDARTDVYALGIVLWEMLTGRRLFDADNDYALLQMVSDPVVEPPSKYRPGLPPALDQVVLTALSKSARARPPAANELRRMLGEAMPAAFAVDSTRLSDLLQTVMADQIEAERRELPQGIAFVPQGQGPEDDPLMTMTLSVDDILIEEKVEEEGPTHVARTGGHPAIVEPKKSGSLATRVLVGLLVAAVVGAGAWAVDRFVLHDGAPVATPPLVAPAQVAAPPAAEPALAQPASAPAPQEVAPTEAAPVAAVAPEPEPVEADAVEEAPAAPRSGPRARPVRRPLRRTGAPPPERGSKRGVFLDDVL